MVLARAMGVILAGMLVSSCQNTVADNGIYYNVGLAEASNNLLLTNVIRSAKGYANYFSLIGDYSGSMSRASAPTASGSVPLHALSQSSVNIGLAPTRSINRNANVSSLETKEFTKAMHTRVAPDLMLFLIESRDEVHVHLIFTMLIQTSRVRLDDYREVVFNAQEECRQRSATLSGAERGICRNFERTLADVTCDFVREMSVAGNTVVTLRNHPTNRCAYSQFRMFAEAVMLNRGRVLVDKAGKINVGFTRRGSRTRGLFDTKGTGVALRSPNAIIQYLGEIVRDQYSRGSAWTPSLTTRSGRSVPIFKVETGLISEHASATAEVDGQRFFIRAQDLGAPETDFSHRALTIVKDLQALNTGRDDLPAGPAIILGPGTNLSR